MSEPNSVPIFETEDIEKNKTVSALAYLIFFLPLIACSESAFGKFHANQALVLLIFNVIGNVVFRFIPFVGGILYTLWSIAMLALILFGLINTLNGKALELPVIGKIRLIK